MPSDDEYDAELAAARERNANWGKIGHPVQSRGLSPKDRTPWLTLLATGLICLVLGRLFLKLQRNYEADFGLWQGEDGAPSRLAGGGQAPVNASGPRSPPCRTRRSGSRP